MKASLILALPVIAAAAATPQLKERQLPPLPSLFDPQCLLKVTGATTCIPNLETATDPVALAQVLLCPIVTVLQILATCGSGVIPN
ncbi:hypothetical protein FACUT_3861 [Fusarium acutatum]|uniref:Hydrophobin n=1 Tax=Fusarium acutatum TaxID=78861 RepID=A0A8H4JZN8_9HYPO|nr:hypothetical protein FACUT_3861 [Fusarium acutatum]